MSGGWVGEDFLLENGLFIPWTNLSGSPWFGSSTCRARRVFIIALLFAKHFSTRRYAAELGDGNSVWFPVTQRGQVSIYFGINGHFYSGRWSLFPIFPAESVIGRWCWHTVTFHTLLVLVSSFLILVLWAVWWFHDDGQLNSTKLLSPSPSSKDKWKKIQWKRGLHISCHHGQNRLSVGRLI